MRIELILKCSECNKGLKAGKTNTSKGSECHKDYVQSAIYHYTNIKPCETCFADYKNYL